MVGATKRRCVLRISLVGALVVIPVALGLWYVIHVWLAAKQLPAAYAAWTAADLVIDHMEAHDGAWPTGWDDILRAAEIREQNGWQLMWEVDELPDLAAIDFSADPTALALAAPAGDEPPFRVITRPDGTDFTVVWEGREPNRMILDYLRSQSEAVSGE